MRIQHQDDDMCFIDRLQRLGDAHTLNYVRDSRAAAHSRRVDQYELTAVPLERH